MILAYVVLTLAWLATGWWTGFEIEDTARRELTKAEWCLFVLAGPIPYLGSWALLALIYIGPWAAVIWAIHMVTSS